MAYPRTLTVNLSIPLLPATSNDWHLFVHSRKPSVDIAGAPELVVSQHVVYVGDVETFLHAGVVDKTLSLAFALEITQLFHF